MSADFFAGPGYSYGAGCTRQVVGACSVLLCDLTNNGPQSPPPGAVQSAGTLTVAGTTPAFSLQYDPGTLAYDPVPAVPTDQLLFAGGDSVMFAAAGADVPAFADTLVAPSPLVVTLPAIVAGALSIDTSKDLVFEWTGASVGKLAFNILSSTASGTAAVSSSFVSCQFDASALTGTIPAAMLQQLQKTSPATTASLSTDLSSTKDIVAGDTGIHLALGSATTQADGKTLYAAAQVSLF